jgi:P2-related tail formation protein
MAKDIYSLSLRDIIPSSIASDAQVQAMIEALDPELQGVSFDTREALIYSRIDELPNALLDLLAWQWHVDFYEPERLSLESKRNLVKSSIPMHRKKGTKWAVEEVLRAIGIEPEITEWFEYGGEPYRFRVNGMIRRPLSPGETWGGDTYSLARRAIMETKSERSWLDSLNLGILFDFGDIIFRWLPARRRELRSGRAVWSLYPRFDFVAADAIPLDWRPWKGGYLRQLRTMRTTGGLTGISHLDRYLSFDGIGADMLPLDVTMPYVETDNPPILAAFLKREKRSANRSIRGPTIAMNKRRSGVLCFPVRLTAGLEGRRQVITAAAFPRRIPDSLDNFFRLDSIRADFLPLDTAVPYVESSEPVCVKPLFFRRAFSASADIPIDVSTQTGRRGFYLMSSALQLSGSAATSAKITGVGRPAERPSHIDDFLRFDSIPADLAPLDKALPCREGNFVWR